ncbi:MAG: hypothetical protein M1819_000705 [Sarea resinae]|nr:MAG: hypothetical protein M1819_000705 [Sarea resinae]
MAAKSINSYPIVFPNPLTQPKGSAAGYLTIKNDSLSISSSQDSSEVVTLSTNTDGDGIKGLLYVPDLAASDPCLNTSALPAHVTRQANLPNSNVDLVALAPWISPDCVQSYLASARADPIRAFIFYPTNTSELPAANDPLWDLFDGGQWKSKNPFPVYAIPELDGKDLMKDLSLYSGNMSDVPFGHQLTEIYDARDYVRMLAAIDTGGHRTVPGFWVFILIVVAILFAVFGLTSCGMHYIQYKRRQTLRRRITRGEVDLEALGIKRLTVPQQVLDKLPLFIYAVDEEPEGNSFTRSKSPTTDDSRGARFHTITKRVSDLTRNSAPSPSSTQPLAGQAHPHIVSAGSPLPHLLYSQPTCPICLDDFVPHETTVRQLPCNHIFHPECVDVFLKENSSLCPICKKSVLPRGYCPTTITNVMVRREMMVRRMRERVVVSEAGNDVPFGGLSMSLVNARARMPSFQHQFGRAAGSSTGSVGGRGTSNTPGPVSDASTRSVVEMGEADSLPRPPDAAVTSPAAAVPVAAVPTPHTAGRREWARQRANALLGSWRTVEEEEREREARLPKWRKAVGSIFPGVR